MPGAGQDSPAHRLFASIIADLAPTNNSAADAEAEDGDESEAETMSLALPPLKTIFDCDMIEKGVVINDNDKVGWRCLWCGNNFFPVHATRALFHVLKMKQGGIAICNGVVDEAHLQRYRMLHQSLSEKPSKARKRSAAEEDDDDGDVDIVDNDHPPSSATKAKRSRATATSKLRNKKHHIVDKKLIEPYHYINATPGKDVRGKLIDCFQLWLNVPQLSILNDIKTIVADLHNASLLIDDIEDNSKLRRGVPVAHSIFGVPSVINTANYVYFLALERCMSLGNDDAMKVRDTHRSGNKRNTTMMHIITSLSMLSTSARTIKHTHRNVFSHTHKGIRSRDAQPPSRTRVRYPMARFLDLSHRNTIHIHGDRQNRWSLPSRGGIAPMLCYHE